MVQAPDIPTTQELVTQNLLTSHAAEANLRQREFVGHNLWHGLFAAIGGCSALATDEFTLLMEAGNLYLLQELNSNIATAQRLCVWKPRTREEDWHGEETTNPGGAHALITKQANIYGRAAMEIAYPYHLDRYGDRLSFVWSGARNIAKAEQLVELALRDPTISFGVKNGLNGEVDEALWIVKAINQRRSDITNRPAPAVLIWRGGENATSPEGWETQRQLAYELTGGLMIDDSAHGTSMAHDPQNKKSNYGQQRALDHIIALSQRGYQASGIMIEASDVVSVTDPNLPFKVGISAVTELVSISDSSR